MKKLILASLMCISAGVQAGPVIDFSGMTAGAAVNDYYNGGTDSLGESGGPNYGVHFSGGVVQYNQFGAYLAAASVLGGVGSIGISFPANIVPVGQNGYFLIGFLATRFDSGSDGGNSYSVDAAGNVVDATFISGTGNPYCTGSLGLTRDQCIAQGYIVPDADLGGFTIGSDGTATRIGFNVAALDNIEFGAPGRPARRRVFFNQVPEPETMALLAVGLFGLVAARRKGRR